MTAVVRRVADGALTVAALAGVVAVLVAVCAAALGVRPVFFRSGSMAPTITTGSMALTRQVPARDLRPGDVVSVRTASGARVTHRVVAATPSGDRVLLTLRGDANRAADPETYAVGAAYRVFWHVGGVGYAVGAMRSPPGLFGAGMLVSVVLVILRGGRGRRRARRRAAKDPVAPRHRARGALAAAAAATLTAAGPAGPASAAAWTDAVPVSGTTFTAGTVAAPALSCGALSVLSVTFVWTPVAGATDYTLHYGIGGASTVAVTGTSYTFLSAISGGTAWVVANHGFGSTTWSSVASNSRSYTVALASLCA